MKEAMTPKRSWEDDDLAFDDDADGLFDDIPAIEAKRPRLEESNGSPDPKVDLARRILSDRFGYTAFRHEQEAAISRVLNGRNSLAIFPTGAGKSLCYQIPAIAFPELDVLDGTRGVGQHGLTIVVSPLIALMKDQVDVLKKKGISAEVMDSTRSYDQVMDTRRGLEDGTIRILYCAPERLNNENFVEMMKVVRGGVRLVAIDEAHCISEWGHSFRPEYLKVARFVEEVRAERVLCLTATATPKVADDICRAFDIQDDCVFRTAPYRPNLHLNAEAVEAEKDKLPKVTKFLREHAGSTLIYVTLQKQAEDLAESLRKRKFDAVAFHAGMRNEEKAKVQDDFMASKVRIVVATIAFGMGVDKANIRSVIHWDLASTIEEYSQQVGRAGRDGKPSHCMFYICPNDFYMRENFARGDLPSRRSLRGFLKDVFREENREVPVGEAFKINIASQSSAFDIRRTPLTVIYASLELRFGLIRAVTPEYSKYQFEAKGKYYAIIKEDFSPEAKAILKCAKKAVKWHNIDVSETARSHHLQRAEIIKKLNKLEERNAIILKASGVENRYKVLRPLPQTEEEINKLVVELHEDLAAREEDAMKRVQQVSDLITGTTCYALALAQHFGMGLPDGKDKCGHCTICTTGKQVVLPPRSPKELTKEAREGIQAILKATDVRDDPRFLARVAFGIKSPRVGQLQLDRKKVFASLADQDFKVSGGEDR